MTSSDFNPIQKIITTLASAAATPIKNKLERNERVINLLQNIGFIPDHPPADFSGVYAYTLVEYGFGKHETVLELFRQDEIRQAFREAFEQNDPSILLREGQNFIEGYALARISHKELKKRGQNLRKCICRKHFSSYKV